MSLTARSKASDVQAIAGHTKTQWKRFLTLTWDEAERLCLSHPTCPAWFKVPADEQEALLERLNKLLAAENIPQVATEVLDWRMAQAVRKAHSSPSIASAEETSELTDRPQASTERPFDPVRDT